MIQSDVEKIDNADIKLSIAIPTYNGSKYIRETLDSIIFQLDDIDEEIEIVISDNASTDGTSEIIKQYQNEHSFIRYFCNNENLGADRNVDLVVRRSRGKHVWLFSDDDKLNSGAIKKVFDVLEIHPNIGFIWVNFDQYNEDFSSCVHERMDLKILEDVYCSPDDFYKTIYTYSVTMSTNIVKRSSWINEDQDMFIGSGFRHFGIVSSYLIKENDAYCINYPYVMIRLLNVSRWTDDGKLLIYILNLTSIIRGLHERGYKNNTINKMVHRLITDMPKICVNAKLQNLSVNISLLNKMIKYYGRYPSFWALDLPLLLIPNRAYKCERIKKIYRMVQIKFRR